MPVANLIQQLFDDGRLVLETDQRPGEVEIQRAVDAVVEFEKEYRESLAPDPPEVDRDAVAWSVELFYLIAQQIAYQHLDQEKFEFHFGPPRVVNSQSSYSVDLVFRFLPDILRLSRASDANALLTESLLKLAADWPLSSVGIALSAEPEIQPILNCRSLRIFYVDRIIEKGDIARLSHSEIRSDVQAAIGANPQLSPKISEFLTTANSNETSSYETDET